MKTDTIYALASGPGRAGVAVIRISGPQAAGALDRLAGISKPVPRRAVKAQFTDPASREVLDDGLALWFEGPASFTGEDVAELHIHGGPAVVSAMLEALGRCKDLRLAEPGEFTRRAFENSKMDLTQAEGLADLVSAQTSAQRRQALSQMQGRLGRLYESWRTRLVGALAHMEAAIDFSDESLPGEIIETVRADVGDLSSEMAAHLEDGHCGERLREGVYVAIIGPPNVGKSSLLNRLARRDAAIVSAEAGTTRDVIEVHMDLGGYPAVLADTAGLGEDGGGKLGEVEKEGRNRARNRARDSDLKLALFTSESGVPEAMNALVDDDTIVALNKIDLGAGPEPLVVNGRRALEISVKSGQGMEALIAALEVETARRCPDLGSPHLTRHRHRLALEECLSSMERFLGVLGEDTCELAAEDLRLAVRALGRITGRVDVEDILDVVFRDFCIGK
ncbi:MAG: tRNA uridine-5-carboxymethylaminomethyl(34) synthesis GTPase MnmE [Rhodospirillales bacterium]